MYLVRLDEAIQLDETQLVEANLTVTRFSLIYGRASVNEVAEHWVRRCVDGLPLTHVGRLLPKGMPHQLAHLMIVTLNGAKK
jgi:hypothetical protein